MKKAFSLSEVLVTLAILGVMAAILIPVINNAKPDKDKLTYKKALYTIEIAYENASDILATEYLTNANANGGAIWTSDEISSQTGLLCNLVSQSLRISGNANCSTSSYTNPNFTTVDGIRYWGLEGGFTTNEKTIYVDRNLSSREQNSLAATRGAGRTTPGLQVTLRSNGDAVVPNTTYEKELVFNGLEVTEAD